jgi:DNA-binding transcriptional regulator YiaG
MLRAPLRAAHVLFSENEMNLKIQNVSVNAIFAVTCAFRKPLHTGHMTPEQCRAARGLLNWTQDQLCEAAKVSGPTVRNFENGKITPHRSSLAVMRQALEAAGVEFIAENGGGPGVRLRKPR